MGVPKVNTEKRLFLCLAKNKKKTQNLPYQPPQRRTECHSFGKRGTPWDSVCQNQLEKSKQTKEKIQALGD